MIRRIFLAVMIVMLLCSCGLCASWTEKAEQWTSSAWQSTKDFFTEDVPLYCGRGILWLKDWWNNSDSKKLDRLTEEVASLRKMLVSFVDSNSGGVRASGFEDSSRSAELDSRDAEFSQREQELTERERALSERERAAASQEAGRNADLEARERALSEREQAAASQEAERNADLEARERALSERERAAASQEAERNADLEAREQALSEREQAAASQEAGRNADLEAREQALSEREQALSERARRQQEAEEKAAKIHGRLKEDEYISRFITSGMLGKIDIEQFMLYDRSYGAVNIPGTPYGTLTANLDTSKFGFIDPGSLKKSLKSLFRDNTLSLRGDSAVVLVRSDDKASWNWQIDSVSDNAFFTLEGLASELQGLQHSHDTSRTEIASFLKVNEQKGRLRIFFRTRHEGLYVLVLMNSTDAKPVIYLAGDSTQKLINRRDLPRALRSSTELRNSGKEAALYFSENPDDSKIDIYLDKFVKGLVEKIPGCKD